MRWPRCCLFDLRLSDRYCANTDEDDTLPRPRRASLPARPLALSTRRESSAFQSCAVYAVRYHADPTTPYRAVARWIAPQHQDLSTCAPSHARHDGAEALRIIYRICLPCSTCSTHYGAASTRMQHTTRDDFRRLRLNIPSPATSCAPESIHHSKNWSMTA